MKLSPWKTETFKLGCFYYTVTHTVKYGSGLHCIYEEDFSDTLPFGSEEYWVDVSDLTEMKIWEFEKLNKLLKKHFGVTVNTSGRVKIGEK